jgi:hypothetical protein
VVPNCNPNFRRRLIVAAAAMTFVAAASIAAQTKSGDPTVAFNTETLIYHRLSCRWAVRCTVNCIPVKLSEARKRGGRACKVCGGGGALADGHSFVHGVDEVDQVTDRLSPLLVDHLDHEN